MKTRRVRWTKRALLRLDSIAAFIHRHNPRAADRVVRRIMAGVDTLTDQPEIRRVGRVKGTRELVLADIPYIIPYRALANEIQVLTVMHASQQWPDKF
jgi:addiction module RelE/StbE family toxin